MAKGHADKITVVAECTVITPNGNTVVKSFDGAWHLALLGPYPAIISFNRFVRIN